MNSGTRWNPPADAGRLQATRLQGPHRADACVVGAGVAGLTIALCLLRSGRSVIVLGRAPVEPPRPAPGADDLRFLPLGRWHGAPGGPHAAEAQRHLNAHIGQWLREQQIDCGFERAQAFLLRAPDADDAVLEREREAAVAAGIAVEECPQGAPGVEHCGPALHFPELAHLGLDRYAPALAAAVAAAGGRLMVTDVLQLEHSRRARVRTPGGHIDAGMVVVCASLTFQRRVVLHGRRLAIRNPAPARLPARTAGETLYWDTGDPWRIEPGRREFDARILALADSAGGADAGAAAVANPFDALTGWARGLSPDFGREGYAWSGQILEPVDGLAFVGAEPESRNTFVLTADSGNGFAHATLAGPLVRSLVSRAPAPFDAIIAPRSGDAGGEAIGWSHWLRPRGEGIEAPPHQGLNRFALYDGGADSLRDAAACCPGHASVHWDRATARWDCPCGGARLAALTGPALRAALPAPPERRAA